ncbi:MAG: restriction endonuclease subunit S [Candidatus Poribacteria bacterium]|nr:restriction endonuclease subunit S [Candidatus Poribacteria bacterium]
MVAQPHFSSRTTENQETESSDFKWTTVNLQEVVETSYRLEAGVYGIEGRQARQDVAQGKWDVVHLCSENGLATAYHRPRFKRIYVEKSSFPIYQPSQINELYPKPSAHISHLTQTDIDALRVKKGQVLLTCSGTIGNCAYVRNTLNDLIFSHDVIRIEPKEYSGFVYAFLKSKTGFSIVNTNNYGAVVKHLEPKHLNAILIPNPPLVLKQEIHDLVEESFKLRDESNELLDAAQVLLKEALELPSIEVLREQAKQFNETVGVLNYSVPLSGIHGRLDGSYYVPIVDVIEQHITITAKEIVKVSNSRISQSVILPDRFKRVYVEEDNGVVFFGGKQLYELDPSNKKYLSIGKHGDRIGNDLKIHTNMTLITRSGTIAKVSIVPKHWEGWIPNEHVIRVVPTSDEIAGYLYAWLSSGYAYPLITRYTYGAVVDEINDAQVSEIVVPLLRDENLQREINDTVLEANQKRTEAYHLEQEALRVLDEKVIYAR